MAELNGEPISIDDLKALALTNFGHFTSMRVDDGRIRGLTLHMARLSRDSRTLFDADLDLEYIRYLARKATAELTGSFIIRITIFDPTLEMGHPGVKAAPKILVTTRAAAALPATPLRLQSVRYSREFPHVKHVGLMGSLRCRRVAQLDGYDDAIFIDSEGCLTEGVTWNVGFFDGKSLVFPQGDILPGVTMALLSETESQIVTARVSLAEVHGMVAAFATNTSIGVRAVSAIDGHDLDHQHPVIKSLQERYAYIEGEVL